VHVPAGAIPKDGPSAGLTDVILPERNRGDLDDIPEEIREQMTFHPVMTIQEVLDVAPEIGGAPLPVRVTGSR
jgi:ATP-dependent Lon protease